MTHDLHALVHDRLDREAAQAPPEPALSDVIDLCERDLTRHRRRVASYVGAAVAAGAAIAVGLTAFVHRPASEPDVASATRLVDLTGSYCQDELCRYH